MNLTVSCLFFPPTCVESAAAANFLQWYFGEFVAASKFTLLLSAF